MPCRAVARRSHRERATPLRAHGCRGQRPGGEILCAGVETAVTRGLGWRPMKTVALSLLLASSVGPFRRRRGDSALAGGRGTGRTRRHREAQEADDDRRPGQDAHRLRRRADPHRAPGAGGGAQRGGGRDRPRRRLQHLGVDARGDGDRRLAQLARGVRLRPQVPRAAARPGGAARAATAGRAARDPPGAQPRGRVGDRPRSSGNVRLLGRREPDGDGGLALRGRRPTARSTPPTT